MGSVANGMALHGGVIPYASTFLVFYDYMRPPVRLAALMGLRVVYVFTHDSIGLGEDGPILGFDGTSECHIDISKAGARYILDGSLSASVLVVCDRCLEPFRHELDFDFRLFLASHLSGSDQCELELSEDDLWVQLVEGSEVDLKDIVREQIYLSLPMKSLCREDCSGLCPSCGINLNKEGCACQRGEGHPG